jgi:hypothetical protein
MQQHPNNGEARDPSQNSRQPATRTLLGVVGANHEREAISQTTHESGENAPGVVGTGIAPPDVNTYTKPRKSGPPSSKAAVSQAAKISSIFAAKSKSKLLIPFTLCEFRSMTTLFHTLNHSG